MPECPKCGNYYKSRSKIRSEARQRTRSLEYVSQIIDILGLQASGSDIERAVDELFPVYYAKKRGSLIDEPVTEAE